jgi:hypothetical protein
MNRTKSMDVSFLHFYDIKNILYSNACILYINVYVVYIQYIYTLQVRISASGTVIHYMG